MTERRPAVLFLDNFDSFSFSLADEFRRLGSRVEVWRNNAPLAKLVERLEVHDLLVASPGPGRPEDAGVLVPLLEYAAGRRPVFGVCLGHQALAVAFGGAVGRAPRLVHGKSGEVHHDGQGIFAGLTESFVAGRYHSLVVTCIPPGFRLTAWVNEDHGCVPMAMEDPERRLLGVQFHPESVLTRDGSQLIERVLTWATT
ncbi:MAG: aminodeoxychorismate/anthranilate synthase component II [Gammaproteobacteria bacterium]